MSRNLTFEEIEMIRDGLQLQREKCRQEARKAKSTDRRIGIIDILRADLRTSLVRISSL